MLRRLVSYSCIYEAHMSPTLNGNSAMQRFKHSDAIEIHDRIIFDFCTAMYVEHPSPPPFGCKLNCNGTVKW